MKAESLRRRLARLLRGVGGGDPGAAPQAAPASAASAFDAALSRRFFETKVWCESSWLGFPILQIPTDLMVLQEIVSHVRPSVIVECGTYQGGSALFFASILSLVEPGGHVISVDVERKDDVREKLDATPFGKMISLVHGSSADGETAARVRRLLGTRSPVLVFLDSDHSYAHVLAEMQTYHSLVTPGSYLIVFDTITRYLADALHGDTRWAEDNPLRAVQEFVASHPEFTIERRWEKYMATFAPCGFLRRTG